MGGETAKSGRNAAAFLSLSVQMQNGAFTARNSRFRSGMYGKNDPDDGVSLTVNPG